MAATFAKHGTLTASVVTSVLLSAVEGILEVVNRSGAAEIYFNVGPQANPPAAPTVGGDDCYVVPASVDSYVVFFQGGPVEVQLISSGTPTFSVVAGAPA